MRRECLGCNPRLSSKHITPEHLAAPVRTLPHASTPHAFLLDNQIVQTLHRPVGVRGGDDEADAAL
jgi:hypothetical protein